MTNEQALKTLDETVIGNLELKMVLSKALEKQIPKEPIPSINKYTGNVNYYNCPNCNHEVWENCYRTKYCESCGQALDWSDVK